LICGSHFFDVRNGGQRDPEETLTQLIAVLGSQANTWVDRLRAAFLSEMREQKGKCR
jgi:hypothetical protein